MTQIEIKKHLNMDAIVMKNKCLEIKVLPRLGFKMAAILYRPKNKEFLFQPTEGKYQMPNYGDDFEKYDTSGLDEMIPTIEKCEYPVGDLKGNILPDHGDVWSVPWNIQILEDRIVGNIKLRSLPLEFIKTISFQGDSTIKMDYKVKNLSDREIYYIWALHGLNVFDDDTEFIFQDDMKNVINIHSNEDLDKIDLKYLKNYRNDRSYKYYFWGKFKTGEVGLDYTRDRIQYMIKYDTDIHPYLGVWITKGGFKGEYNCALEPSNGFYDSVSLAYENKMVPLLSSYGEDRWTIYIDIRKY
ncbi:MAG: hypothetical protein AB2375_00295 [Tissierellaceae bacterium]